MSGPEPSERPRPRPTPRAKAESNHDVPPADPDGPLVRMDVQPSHVVAAAGTAIVTAARFGRLLGRSGWRIARQLPGAQVVEREAQRLQHVAVDEARRWLQVPSTRPTSRTLSPEEQRALDYIRDADPGTAPLRSAMSELLERSVEATRTDSRTYLFGTIMSQLVPDEARILAALGGSSRGYVAGDVVLRGRRRGRTRVLLANVSGVGRSAGVVAPDNVPTYLTRLLGFGLIEFGPADDGQMVQYDILATDSTVQAARNSVDARRRGAVKLLRKTVHLSALGREFWAASDPSRPALAGQPRYPASKPQPPG